MRAVIRRKWGDIHLSAHLKAEKSERLVNESCNSEKKGGYSPERSPKCEKKWASGEWQNRKRWSVATFLIDFQREGSFWKSDGNLRRKRAFAAVFLKYFQKEGCFWKSGGNFPRERTFAAVFLKYFQKGGSFWKSAGKSHWDVTLVCCSIGLFSAKIE